MRPLGKPLMSSMLTNWLARLGERVMVVGPVLPSRVDTTEWGQWALNVEREASIGAAWGPLFILAFLAWIGLAFASDRLLHNRQLGFVVGLWLVVFGGTGLFLHLFRMNISNVTYRRLRRKWNPGGAANPSRGVQRQGASPIPAIVRSGDLDVAFQATLGAILIALIILH